MLPVNANNGWISIHQVMGEYGSNFNSLNNMRGIAPGVPVVGTIGLSNMYGTSASVPAVVGAAAEQLRDSLDGIQGQSFAVNELVDAYGAPITYSIVSAPASPLLNSSIAPNGTVTFSAASNALVSGNIVVRGTNRFGRCNIVTVPMDIGPRPSVLSSASASGLSNVPRNFNLSALFNNPSGASLGFTLAANPRNNGVISGNNLAVTPAFRNAAYTLAVTASNKYGTSSLQANVDIVELPPQNTNQTWVTRTSPGLHCRSICWSPQLSLFVVVGITSPRVMTSPNGITWTSRTPAVLNSWTSVCWSPELLMFVAVSTSGDRNRVMTSLDGTTWTTRTSAADDAWQSVCWSPELSLFVAVAEIGASQIMTSPNGITWTSRIAPTTDAWSCVCWASALSLFVATARSGNGRIMTSPDGITWTSRTAAASNSWESVCWSPQLSLLVAVSSSGTGNRVMTSPNGINWTSRVTADNNWNSVCWSPERSEFTAVASTGTGNRVMTSSDGITWQLQSSVPDHTWRSVCWAPQLGIYSAVVSMTGGIIRVMTTVA